MKIYCLSLNPTIVRCLSLAILGGKKVKRILVDGGSAINIMPKSTMNDLGITIDGLSKSRMMIQGFNLEGQRAISMIRLELAINDLSTTSTFRVIDLKTLYKLLLEQPWLHKHGVVASTLHQCLKYYRDGEKKVNGDTKPFAKAESYFADARFFDEDAPLKEAMPATISSTGKRSEEDTLRMIHGGPSGNVKQSQLSEKKTSKPLSPLFTQAVVATRPAASVFRYILKSCRKDGEAPFSECTTLDSVTKPISKLKETDWHVLKGKGMLPTHKASQSKVVRAPLADFLVSSKGSLHEEVD